MTKEEKQKLLNDYLTKKNITNKDFSEEIGYTQTTISLLKNGKLEIPTHLMWGIKQAMEVMRLQEKILE